MIKRIALVAHDSRKQELVDWVTYNMRALAKCELYATGTTGKLIQKVFSDSEDENLKFVEVHRLLSGPLGGDAQIGAMIAEGKIDYLIFFCDNLVVQGHNNDVLGLSRLASLYNIGYSTNRTTADLLISSPLFMDENYKPIVPRCIENYASRKL